MSAREVVEHRKSSLPAALRRWRSGWIALGTGFTCALAGQLASHALLIKPAEVTSIWIPGGLILAFLALRPVRLWPQLLCGFIAGGVSAFALRSGMIVFPAIGYLWISACIAAGAAVIRLAPGQQYMFPSLAHLARFFLFVVVGVSAACSSGFVGVVSVLRDDVSLPRLWVLGTTAFAVGFMLITPLVVDFHTTRLPRWRHLRKRVVGFVLFSVSIWMVSILAWRAVPSNISSVPLLLFAPVPLLMLAAFQFERFGPSVGLLVAFVPSIVVAIRMDRVETFEMGLVNSYVMQLWTLSAGVLVHALAIQARQRSEILERLLVTSEEKKSLVTRLMQSQEEQSIRISRELHDGVNQKLTFFSIALSSLKQRSPGELQGPIEQITVAVRELIDEVRNISHSLHPAVLEHAGIGGAIDDLVRVIEGRWGGEIGLRIEIEAASRELKGERALCMYRVAQESIRNAIEHSGASSMKIVLSATDDRWRLCVTDNGCGFEPKQAMRGGLGLLSMKERVALAGGRLRIRSRPGRGTTVAMELSA